MMITIIITIVIIIIIIIIVYIYNAPNDALSADKIHNPKTNKHTNSPTNSATHKHHKRRINMSNQ